MKMMIVDDDTLLTDLVAMRLCQEGFGVSAPASAAAAVAEIAAEAPDLLLLDIRMPDLDGLTVLKIIRGLAACSHTRVLMLTSEDDLHYIRGAREAGANGFLSKPINLEQLVQTVHRLAASDDLTWIDDHHVVTRGKPVAQPAPSPSSRVLVVEDIEINRDLVRLQLERLGCSVDTVGDGEAALEQLSCAAYDLVLMDIRLPGISGLEAIRRIRDQGGPAAGAPIVALSAQTLPEDRAAAAAAGADGFIAKPFTQAQLDAGVRDAIGRAA